MLWLVLGAALAGDGAFDHTHAAFDAFLDGAVTDAARVDYALLATRRPALDVYLADLATAPVETFTTDQKLALWVNAYNGHTIATILDEMPASILDLDGGKVWSSRTFTVGGETVTLDDLEHAKARTIADGRVHAVVNCASIGCPPLPADALVASTVESQMDAAARRWMSTNGYSVKDGTLYLSKIFDWYGSDFTDPGALTGEHAGPRAFVAKFAPEADAERIRSGELAVAFGEYDWSLNGK